MPLFDTLTQMLACLEDQGQRAALLGGLAVSAWTEPRFTRDVDLAVAVHSDADAELLVRRLSQNGYRVLATVEQKATHRLASARLLPHGETAEGMVVDLLFASSGIERDIVAAAAELDIGAGTAVRVARVGHLVALKLLSHDPQTRPQDGLDLRLLRSALDATEAERARVACGLIVQRGFNRGRELQALLESYLATTQED
ncbi:MAG: nucleotidyl transferase AbiEii/AbiGii toxin family protein [Thermomonas sp.]|uniref:nucleotidyl transferase AbiEii/AbiGii toxin family protein n=1 Tax=Thermomonas sp. TaxID=1971895 RepID=UPI0039E49DCE